MGRDTPDTLDLRLGGERFARYRYGPEVARPHIEALFAPGGRLVTRKTRTDDDHPHHRGVWAGHRDVDGVDHWTEFAGHGRIVHRGFDSVGEDGFVERLDWLDPDGRPALAETRALRVSEPERGSATMEVVSEAATASTTMEVVSGAAKANTTLAATASATLDFEFRLRARDRAVTLGDEKDAALLAVRVAPTMHTIENAAGGRGESECWGRRAAWCDYSGPVDGEVFGIAVLDHPHNPRHPPPWHVRDYGLLAANPFGLRALATTAEDGSAAAAEDGSAAAAEDGSAAAAEDGSAAAAEDGSVRLAAGAEIVFRYRLIVHAGDAAAARIADRHREYGS